MILFDLAVQTSRIETATPKQKNKKVFCDCDGYNRIRDTFSFPWHIKSSYRSNVRWSSVLVLVDENLTCLMCSEILPYCTYCTGAAY